jgi:16S rRNA (cytosine967-C5)-methyltransferase
VKRSSLIGHTVELVDIFRGSRPPADRIIKEFYRTRRYLGARDRRYISEFFFGVLRHFRLLEVITAGAFRQSGFPISGDRIPSVALCAAYLVKLAHEDVALLSSDIADLWRLSVLENPVAEFMAALPMVGLPEDITADPAKRIAVEQSFPDFIVAEWVTTYGAEQTERLCQALNESACVTVRVNTLKVSVEECSEALAREGVTNRRTMVSPFGLVLEKRVDVHVLRAFRDGWFEVQDEASQLIALLLEPGPGQMVIDACAGGGGKTLHIGALMSNSGKIIAIDTEERRLREVTPRSQRAGVSIVQLLLAGRDRGSVAQLAGTADAVLIDAPCSGVGTFRRNPGGKFTVSPEAVLSLSRAQAAILEEYSHLVKPGGRLVYSTCTLLNAENQGQIDSFLSLHREFSLIDAPAILRNCGVPVEGGSQLLRLLPHQTGTDGFFAAVMVRSRSVDS